MDSAAPGPPTVAPIEGLVQAFVTNGNVRRIKAGAPGTRPVFRRVHGGAHGTFTIRPSAKADFGIGIFAHDVLPAWVRFSSDTSANGPDLGAECGIGIKLFLPNPATPTQDFLLQN